MNKMSLPTGCFAFFLLFIMIMHPYTIYGKPGVFAVFFFVFVALKDGIERSFFKDFVLPSFFLFILGIFGAISSIANGIPQMNHPFTVFSFLIMLFAAKGVFSFFKKRNVELDDFVFLILMVVALNSVIVLIELQFDGVRQMIEQNLDQLTEASINYSEGFRLRGVASSGGAGLSISVPAAVIMALYLFDRGRIGIFFLIFLFILFFTSVMVIGRSGVVLLAVPAFCYVILLLSKKGGFKSLLKGIFLVLLFSFLVVPIFYQYISSFFSEMFGDGFMKYAFGFLLDGGDGIKEEGTVDAVAEFLTVLPLQFPQALVGYGFYGGSAFYPWSDSGISRMFLSIGFVFGTIFYIILLKMYFLPFKRNKFLIGAMVLLLLAAEAKEVLLYSGVASRMYILLLVYCYFDALANKKEDMLREK